jgi:hypothetical protein
MEQHQGSLHKRVTPLPKLQLSVLLYLLLAEPITSTVILPFIVQVCASHEPCFASRRITSISKLVEETGITGGDVSKIGYYAGLVVCVQDLAPLAHPALLNCQSHRNPYSFSLKLS